MKDKKEVRKKLRKYFRLKEEAKEINSEISSLRSGFLSYMKKNNTGRLLLDDEHKITLVEPTSLFWDEKLLKRYLKRNAARKAARVAGLIKGEESLVSRAFPSTESLDVSFVEELIEVNILTPKQVKSCTSLRKNQAYLR